MEQTVAVADQLAVAFWQRLKHRVSATAKPRQRLAAAVLGALDASRGPVEPEDPTIHELVDRAARFADPRRAVTGALRIEIEATLRHARRVMASADRGEMLRIIEVDLLLPMSDADRSDAEYHPDLDPTVRMIYEEIDRARVRLARR